MTNTQKDIESIENEAKNLVQRKDFEEEKIKEQEAILQMEYAYGWAKRLCYAKRRKVGAVIYKERSPLSCGYNGTPSGEPNECEDVLESGELVTKPHTIHAEENAFDKLTVSGNNSGTKNATLFVTTAPCINCAKRVHNCKISAVYFTELYRSVDGLEHLIKHGVTIHHIDMLKEEIYTIYKHDPSETPENSLKRKIAAISLCRETLKNYTAGKYHTIID